MPGKLHTWLKANLPVLFDEKMPVWMTIVASLLAAVATYYFAPLYSHQFQVEDVRSAHLKETTDHLNEAIIDLSQKVRRFDTALANKDKKALELHEDCLDLITKIQWQLVDLRVVLTSPDDGEYVTRLSNAINVLRNKLNAPVKPTYRSDISVAMGGLAQATMQVLQRLYAKASLQG